MTTKLNRYLTLVCLVWIVCVLAIKPLRAQEPKRDFSQSDRSSDSVIHSTTPADPKDAQIAALTARVADLERRVKLLEEFRTKALPLLSLVIDPILSLQQQFAQLDVQKPKEKP